MYQTCTRDDIPVIPLDAVLLMPDKARVRRYCRGPGVFTLLSYPVLYVAFDALRSKVAATPALASVLPLAVLVELLPRLCMVAAIVLLLYWATCSHRCHVQRVHVANGTLYYTGIEDDPDDRVDYMFILEQLDSLYVRKRAIYLRGRFVKITDGPNGVSRETMYNKLLWMPRTFYQEQEEWLLAQLQKQLPFSA